MLLQRTLFQLDIGQVPPEQALALGSLGYRQWLDALPAHFDYLAEARYAHEIALPLASHSPAVAVFCQLLAHSMAAPLVPLPLFVPAKTRRGGTKARRHSL